MAKEINRKKFFEWTIADEKTLQEHPDGFGIQFDTFAEVAQFFTQMGSTGYSNENANSLTNRGFYEDEANGLAQDAYLSTIRDGYFVHFDGWALLS